MSAIIEKDLEQKCVDLIGDILKLNEINAHIARCEEEMQKLNIAEDANVNEFYRLKRNFLQQIYRNLLDIDVRSAFFAEVLVDMIPEEDVSPFRKQLMGFEEKIEVLLAS